MYPNSMSRAFGRKTAPQHQRSATILHSGYEVLFCMAIFLFTPNPPFPRLSDPTTQLTSTILQLCSLEILLPVEPSSSRCVGSMYTHVLFQADSCRFKLFHYCHDSVNGYFKQFRDFLISIS